MLHNLTQFIFSAEVFLLLSVFVLLMIGAFQGERSRNLITILSLFAVLISFWMVTTLGDQNAMAINGMFKTNSFIVFVKGLFLISGAFCLILFVGNSKYNNKIKQFELPILMLLSLLGMMVMVSAGDFMSFYMGLELQSLTIYVLTASSRKNIKSSEAGLKYFILGALSSAILLYGISLIYGFTGSINFAYLATLKYSVLEHSSAILLGMVLIIVALCFKVAAVPFHMWSPDVYEGSPTPITVFIASAPKVAAIAIFIRLLTETFGGFAEQWQPIIIFVAIASMLVGALGAIMQKNIKRLLAYSSIGHIGYMLMGLAVSSPEAVKAILIYLAIYIAAVIGAFAFIMAVKQSHHSADSADKKPLEDIETLSGLVKSMPFIAVAMAILLLSMAGIPPFAGFFGKFFIFKTVIDAGLINLAIIGAVSAVISAYYYLRIIKIMFFDEVQENFNKSTAMPIIYVLALAALFNLAFFVKPTLLLDLADKTVVDLRMSTQQ
jgi:NADH-quinone oxidoreductase subunit N